MAERFDYAKMRDDMSQLLRDYLGNDIVPVPVELALKTVFALDRLRKIEGDVQGEFQLIRNIWNP